MASSAPEIRRRSGRGRAGAPPESGSSARGELLLTSLAGVDSRGDRQAGERNLGRPENQEDTVKVILNAMVGAAALLALSSAAYAAGDPVAGEQVFKKCKVCHATPGEAAKNMVGPVLNGIVGRKAGTYPGYNYSDAIKYSGLTWDEATLAAYLKDPRAKVPGTKMTFAGLSSATDIDNVIAYLALFDESGKKK